MRIPPRPERDPNHFVTVLLVSPLADDHEALAEIFAHTNWRLTSALTIERASAALRTGRHSLVICERRLLYGTWEDLFERTRNMPSQPLLIITSLQPDNHLWAEALNLGAFDVLPKPFERQEVVHVVSFAWLHWRNQRRQREREMEALGRAACG